MDKAVNLITRQWLQYKRKDDGGEPERKKEEPLPMDRGKVISTLHTTEPSVVSSPFTERANQRLEYLFDAIDYAEPVEPKPSPCLTTFVTPSPSLLAPTVMAPPSWLSWDVLPSPPPVREAASRYHPRKSAFRSRYHRSPHPPVAPVARFPGHPPSRRVVKPSDDFIQANIDSIQSIQKWIRNRSPPPRVPSQQHNDDVRERHQTLKRRTHIETAHRYRHHQIIRVERVDRIRHIEEVFARVAALRLIVTLAHVHMKWKRQASCHSDEKGPVTEEGA